VIEDSNEPISDGRAVHDGHEHKSALESSLCKFSAYTGKVTLTVPMSYFSRTFLSHFPLWHLIRGQDGPR